MEIITMEKSFITECALHAVHMWILHFTQSWQIPRGVFFFFFHRLIKKQAKNPRAR